MSLPTLLQPGGLLATKWSPSQEILDKYKPLDYIINWIKEHLKHTLSPANRILVLKSATGSGKSAVLPPELYHVFFEDMKRNIGSLQPQRFNAIDIPTNSVIPFNTKTALKKAGYPGRTPLELGENIGYQTGIAAVQPTRGIIYMTIGTLQQQLNIMSDDDFMNKYAFIIIDEAHKRSIDTDIVMSAMKAFIYRNYKNPLCPFLIITSATFDTVKYCDWVLDGIKAPERYKNIIDVKGKTTYPIHETFLKYDSKNAIESAIETIVKIHKEFSADFGVNMPKPKRAMLKEDKIAKEKAETYYRDILVFVAGSKDVEDIKKAVDMLNSEHPFFQKYPVLPLRLTGLIIERRALDYQYLFKEIEELNVEIITKNGRTIKKPTRRVMIATNVGEVGITYKALKHVIDTGLYKSKEVTPTFGSSALILKPITQGIHIQRKGRTGRRAPGYSYPMFTEESYNDMRKDELPGILRDDITNTLLNLIIMNVDPDNKGNEYQPVELFTDPQDGNFKVKQAKKEYAEQLKKAKIDITKLDLLDLPSADSLHMSLEKLYTLGAIDSNSCPTPIGFLMNKFRYIPMESVKMILSGYAWKAPITDLITIACLINRGVWLFPRNLAKNRQEAERLNLTGMSNLDEKSKKLIPNYTKMYNSLLIADDFINTLILFYEFQEKVEEQFTTQVQDLANLEEWCEQRGASFKSIIDAIDERDQTIQTLAMIGFDPYANSEKELRHVLKCYNNCSKNELIERVKLLKQCIYEGYKLNIAEWNAVCKAYISRNTHVYLPIDNPLLQSKKDIFKQGDSNPRFIIFDNLSMRLNPKTNVYTTSVGYISVLDGYVAI